MDFLERQYYQSTPAKSNLVENPLQQEHGSIQSTLLNPRHCDHWLQWMIGKIIDSEVCEVAFESNQFQLYNLYEKVRESHYIL